MDKIYVAEDDQSNRYFLKKVLVGAGYGVDTFKNGKELLDALNSCKPDLIVTDVRMPVMDGFELVDKIRELHGYNYIPIIITSATFQDINNKIKGFDLGANDYMTPLIDEDELIAKVKSMIRIKKMYKKLQESEERLAFVLNATNDGIWDNDLKSGELFLSDQYYRMLGYKPGEIIVTNKDFEDSIHPEDKEQVLRKIQECIEGKTKEYSAEFRMKTKSGKWKWILGRGNAVSHDSNGKALRFLGTHVDISRPKQMEEELKKLARVDSLTGCCSRGYGLELLDRQIKLSHRNKSPLSLAFLDIDGFKNINDNFGHAEGDKVLKKSVRLFKSTLREVDIICRMGGDEFLLIFPDISLQETSLIISRLQKRLSQLNKTIKENYRVSFSIGLSEYLPDQPKTLNCLC